jgi:predicted branched-subunit amino acid permease
MKARFTFAGIRAGYIKATPLAISTLIYGFSFGVLASEAKLSALEAVLMSAVVYSGSAQLAGLQGWQISPLLLPLMATILVVNARYMLYGAALRPWLGSLPASRVFPSLFLMGDHNWALAMNAHAQGEDDAGFLFGSGLAMFVPWTTGTLIGHLGGSFVQDPARFGLDFMLVALSAGMAIAFWRGRSSLLPGGAALITALVLHRFIPGGWTVVCAGLAGGAVAYATHRDPADAR